MFNARRIADLQAARDRYFVLAETAKAERVAALANLARTIQRSEQLGRIVAKHIVAVDSPLMADCTGKQLAAVLAEEIATAGIDLSLELADYRKKIEAAK